MLIIRINRRFFDFYNQLYEIIADCKLASVFAAAGGKNTAPLRYK